MKRNNLCPTLLSLLFSIAFLSPFEAVAQRRFPTLSEQLNQKYLGRSVAHTSKLAGLISDNQEFGMLRPDEFNDKRGLPPWLRVWYRKHHPDLEYSASDPTKGYPLALKEILEWMVTHQDLKPGPGESADEPSPFIQALIGTNLRVSGQQSAPRSESYIQINYFDPTKILIASNNIGGTGRQGIYRSSDGGATWAQTELPLAPGDEFHSDPTVDFSGDGRAWSSAMGIDAGGDIRLRNYFSTDNGATWTFDATMSGSQVDVDKQIVWVDKSSTSPYFNQQYAIWHNGTPAFMNRRTAGPGGTWLANPINVSVGDGASGTRLGGDVKTNAVGDVFGFYPSTGNRGIYVVKSTDGGNTYGTARRIANTFGAFDIGVPSFSSRRAFIYVSAGAYRTVSKNLVYASWTDLSGDAGCTTPVNEPDGNVNSGCKMRVWFSRSTDGGATWSTPVKINNQAGNNDQFSQWLAVDETNGNIGIMYNDTVGDAGRLRSDVWFQTSYDDGVTWTAPEKVTTAMTDETNAGADLGNQYGDYNGLSGYANVFFPSWTDRRNNAREEIWTAMISLGPPPPPAANLTASALPQVTSGNGVVEPNECNLVNIPLTNNGNLAATGVSATLSSTTPGVSVAAAASGYPDIPAGGGTQSNTTPFQVSTSNGVACFTTMDLSLTVTYAGSVSPRVFNFSLPVGRPADPNYTFASATDSIPAGGILVPGSSADDAVVSVALPAGFSSTVYGAALASLSASTNGTLKVNGAAVDAFENEPLPSTPATGPYLFPYWDDLDASPSTTVGGGIFTNTVGAAPNRTFIVEWRTRHYVAGQPVGPVDTKFAVVLTEGSEVVRYVYELTGAGPFAGGVDATVGAQASNTGTQFTQFSFNQASLSPGQLLTGERLPALCAPGAAPCSVAATASVSGRVVTPDARGLRNAVVSITNPQGQSRTTTTSSFGLYNFDNVATGSSYTIRISSKRFRFQAQVVSVNGNLSNIDFVGAE